MGGEGGSAASPSYAPSTVLLAGTGGIAANNNNTPGEAEAPVAQGVPPGDVEPLPGVVDDDDDDDDEVSEQSRWCIRCFRSAVLDWTRRYRGAEPQPFPASPLVIQCRRSDPVSTKCDRCRRQRSPCETVCVRLVADELSANREQVPLLMQGDCLDLCRALAVLEDLINLRRTPHGSGPPQPAELSEEEGGRRHVLPQVVRRRLARLSYEMCATFSNVEKQHRTAFGLTGARRHVAVSMPRWNGTVSLLTRTLAARLGSVRGLGPDPPGSAEPDGGPPGHRRGKYFVESWSGRC